MTPRRKKRNLPLAILDPSSKIWRQRLGQTGVGRGQVLYLAGQPPRRSRPACSHEYRAPPSSRCRDRYAGFGLPRKIQDLTPNAVQMLATGAAGIRRVGNQLRGFFLGASEIALTSGRIEEEFGRRKLKLESVVRSAGSPPVVVRKRGPRRFEEIPPSEIAEIMRSILRTNPTVEREVLYRRVLDFYELKRLTSNVRRSLDRIISDEEFDLAE